jgi:hypothetical protein
MRQAELDFQPARKPRGKSGAVLDALLATSPGHPLTPLDLHKDPARYGTSCMRLLRFMRKWIEINTPYRVVDRQVDGGALYHQYWIIRKSANG